MKTKNRPITKTKTFTKAILGEFIATFILVFCGTGAIIIDQQTQGGVTHVGVAMTFGLVVMCLIYAFGTISGAHMNPAVSIAFVLARRLQKGQLLRYIGSQLFGAFVASITLKLLFPSNLVLGATLPHGSAMQSFLLEIILTFFLMLTVLHLVYQKFSVESGLIGVVVGAVVGLEALFAGPISGASMNPARSFGPAVVSGQLGDLWIYLLAPTLGAALAVPVARFFHPKQDTPSESVYEPILEEELR
ncbi:aquaporin [Olivibacter ginsenosidimutans]|uniref:Aquaporin n=1 Tax=Olivibacter ginsenosidimutans TaxID=1176537 RepID=A0ABP9BXV9_9SPHI